MRLLLILLVYMFVGCFSAPQQTRSPLNLPPPAPLKMRPVKWIVMPPNESAPEGDPTKDGTVIGMSEDGYKNLAQNFREVLNYMAVQRKIIKSYQRYYEQEK